ncbi:MAG: hypothetical protein AAGA60_00860 [Cyanobacteria bacterium P01_E01_bin.42]
MSQIDYSQFPNQKLEKLLQETSDQNEVQRITSELKKRRTEELINLITPPDNINRTSLETTSLNNFESPLVLSKPEATSIVPISSTTPINQSSSSGSPTESKNKKGLWFVVGFILLSGILSAFYYFFSSVRRDFNSQIESLNNKLGEAKSELENLRRENERISSDLKQKEQDNNQIKKQLDDTRVALREARNVAPRLAHSWKEQLLFQDQCFQRGTVALKNAGFTNDFVSDEKTGSVLGEKNGYRASIRCVSDKGLAFFVVAGSDSDEIIKFANLINSNF